MVKPHYCNKIANDKICGQNNPEKFHKNNKSTCKECAKNKRMGIITSLSSEPLGSKPSETETKIDNSSKPLIPKMSKTSLELYIAGLHRKTKIMENAFMNYKLFMEKRVSELEKRVEELEKK